MFTNERQDTLGRTGWSIHRWLFRGMSRLGAPAHGLAVRLRRRTDWFTYNLTVRRFVNLCSAVAEWALKRETVSAWPCFVIIDISPLCNLHCTVCLHADPNGNPNLEEQDFHGGQKMTVEQFREIIDEIRDHALGVLLYYIGDPLVHPDLEAMCGIAYEAGLVSHVSTNFSVPLSDARIRRLVTCGLSHLTVCVDGLSQGKYQRTRVGGRIDRVVNNLRRVCAVRRALRRSLPRIEVQYIKYQHNLDELVEARRMFMALGVDQLHELWGWLHNYTDRDPGQYTVFEPRPSRWLPHCHWTHLFTLIKYNGDVIPCCAFRLGHQYARGEDPRAVGNVFTTPFRQVWNSPEYRRVRRLVCDPEAIRSNPSLADTFCDACPRLFESDYQERTCRYGSEYTFEQFYTIGANGRPRRRDCLAPTGQGKRSPVFHDAHAPSEDC